jgi:hypothetical protein
MNPAGLEESLGLEAAARVPRRRRGREHLELKKTLFPMPVFNL